MKKTGTRASGAAPVTDPLAWFVGERPRYDALKAAAGTIIENLIVNAEIDYLSVSARTKTVDSFQQKLARKQYQDPATEMTDLVGIRVICYIESDVERVCTLVHETMRVYPLDSPDKSSDLAVDRVGYRSTHFVCDLGPIRLDLPEYKLFQDLRFEIQVRTVLQHAWAEIEHDRSYKFSGTLPPELRRRLFLLAGTLEVVDREFSNIAAEIDEYAATVTERTRSGDLDIEIDSVSLERYMRERFKSDSRVELKDDFSIGTWVLPEIAAAGVTTLKELDDLLTSEFVGIATRLWNPLPPSLLISAAVITADPERVFKKRKVLLSDLEEFTLTEKYGEKQLSKWVKDYGLRLIRVVQNRPIAEAGRDLGTVSPP